MRAACVAARHGTHRSTWQDWHHCTGPTCSQLPHAGAPSTRAGRDLQCAVFAGSGFNFTTASEERRAFAQKIFF